MKTQDQDARRGPINQAPHRLIVPTADSSANSRSKGKRRLAILGAIIVVALILTASAVVFAQLAQRHAGQTAPPPGQWESVLTGYTLTSLVAARSNPAMLYT